jgi:sterol desaturase/sphingolipid hydroxylase (fatty acid hydroxylase superfamily)
MQARAYELVQGAASTFVLMALIFWPLEKVFPARSGQRLLRREWVLDLTFFVGQHLLFGWTSLLMLGWLAAGWTSLVPAATTVLHGLPMAAKVLVAILLGDLLTYWGHRLQHRVPFLWRFHAVHHSSTTLDWLAAHREPHSMGSTR